LGDEGGSLLTLNQTKKALKLLSKQLKKLGYKTGEDVLLAMDAASS